MFRLELTNKEKIYILNKLSSPHFFIRNILGVEHLTSDQEKVINSVWNYKYTGVKAAHGVGKTFLGACITLAFLYTNPNSIVITTAPTMRQVRDLLWNEISNLYQKAKFNLGGKLLQVRLELGPKWYAEGIATDPGKEEASAVKIQGYHAEKILIIIDEAVGVHPTIWEAIDGITSSEGAKVLAIGNPSTTNCQFYKALKSGDWNELSISALNHTNVIRKQEVIKGAVSYKWVKDKIRKWCSPVTQHNPKFKTFEFEGVIYKPNSLFLWKVLGEFPLDEADRFIPIEKIENSVNRAKIFGLEKEIRDMAIDVARFGGDASVVAVNIGNNFQVFKFYDLDLIELSNEVVKLIKQFKPYRVGIDCDGIGAGLYDIISDLQNNGKIIDDKNKNIEFELYEIRGTQAPIQIGDTKEKFANFRTQMWSLFKSDIDYIKLPDDEDLEEELNTPIMKTDRFGRTLLEPKDNIRQKIGRSPDTADAVIYCNALKYINKKDLKYLFID